MRTLVWFRSDLRARDNTALLAACRRSDQGVVGLFIISPQEWRDHEVAPVRIDFLMRSLRELSAALEARGIPLRVEVVKRASDVPKAVLAQARACACDAIAFNREYEVDESRRDAAVIAAAAKHALQAWAFTDQIVLAPEDVRTKSDTPFRVFTPFKKQWLTVLEQRGGVEVGGLPPRQSVVGVASTPIPDSVSGFTPPPHASMWEAGEAAARKRLDRFVENRLDAYQDARDQPGIDSTSQLSPYLASGCLSPRQCIAAAWPVHAKAPRGGASTWISELIWREFYVHVLAAFPRVCMGRAFQPATERIAWRTNPGDAQAWREGRTGIPIVDAGMRQLATTGWMHNRVRMITAMFLAKNLLLDWRTGESWFMRNLVDGFFASNNGGWQWAASTGTDAVPYFRVFNPVTQSLRFDPEGAYIRRYVPELEALSHKSIHEPWRSKLPPRDYPKPIVDLASSRKRAIETFRAIRGAAGERQ